jgi:hypothetical protein
VRPALLQVRMGCKSAARNVITSATMLIGQPVHGLGESGRAELMRKLAEKPSE